MRRTHREADINKPRREAQHNAAVSPEGLLPASTVTPLVNRREKGYQTEPDITNPLAAADCMALKSCLENMDI